VVEGPSSAGEQTSTRPQPQTEPGGWDPTGIWTAAPFHAGQTRAPSRRGETPADIDPAARPFSALRNPGRTRPCRQHLPTDPHPFTTPGQPRASGDFSFARIKNSSFSGQTGDAPTGKYRQRKTHKSRGFSTGLGCSHCLSSASPQTPQTQKTTGGNAPASAPGVTPAFPGTGSSAG